MSADHPILSPSRLADPQLLQEQAWIGDAVLCLYAREWILARAIDSKSLRSDLFTHFTSNHFLSSLGEPTRIEAEIGGIYQQQGIAAAYRHISTALLPLFLRQIRNKWRGTVHNHLIPQLEEAIDG